MVRERDVEVTAERAASGPAFGPVGSGPGPWPGAWGPGPGFAFRAGPGARGLGPGPGALDNPDLRLIPPPQNI